MPAGWSLPPAASPINTTDILHAVRAGFGQEKTVHDVKQSLHDYFGAAHVSLVSSGTGALCLALRALHAHYPARNRVLIPAYSCYSVPAAVEAAGLSAMLCDVDPQTLDFDYADLSFRLQQYADTLVAVVPIHLYGIPADINRIRALCRKYDIAIIEDAAQAMGATYEGKPAGMHGDIGVFSLGRGKALSAVEGGIVLTNDSRFAKTLDTLIGPLATY
ncbi:MAG: DegT/DnrJ/EryC1/StrS family aminotransferase, partial [Chitinivibrionales bacterium]